MKNELKNNDLKKVSGGNNEDESRIRDIIALLIKTYESLLKDKPNATEEEKEDLKKEAFIILKQQMPDIDDSKVGAIWIGG